MADHDQVKIAQAVAAMRDNLPAMIEFQKLNAKLIRARYLALVDAGFTESQALELCQRGDDGKPG